MLPLDMPSYLHTPGWLAPLSKQAPSESTCFAADWDELKDAIEEDDCQFITLTAREYDMEDEILVSRHVTITVRQGRRRALRGPCVWPSEPQNSDLLHPLLPTPLSHTQGNPQTMPALNNEDSPRAFRVLVRGPITYICLTPR